MSDSKHKSPENSSSRPTERVSRSGTNEILVKETKFYKANGFSVFWLGICVVIGGQTISWNTGLHMGYWEFFIATMALGLAYFCLTFCLAEITSILPFAGGSYGYVRCSLGPPIGFMIGFAESVEYIMYTSAAVVVIGELFHELSSISYDYLPLTWLLFYALALPINILGGPYAWYTAVVIGMVTVCMMMVWCLMDIDNASLARYEEEAAIGGHAKEFMQYFPYAAWFYKGIEVMTLTSRNTTNPTKTVPRSMLAVMAVVFVSSICVLLTAGSVYPGPSILAEDHHTFDALVVHALKSTTEVGTLFMLPGAMGSAFGFMYAFGQQLHSMANSGLLSDHLRMVCGIYGTPHIALIAGSILSYACVLVLYYTIRDLEEVVNSLFDICLLSSCSVDIALFAAYYVFRTRYSGLERGFTNPLGYGGVAYGVLLYAFMGIAIAFFGKDDNIAIIVFVCIMAIGYVWYMCIARKTEFFSKEEQTKFMKAYVLNANVQKKKKKRVNSKSRQPQSSFRVFAYVSRLLGVTAAISDANPSMSKDWASKSSQVSNLPRQSKSSNKQEYSGVGPN